MSCIITYNGQNFTQEDFLEYLKTQIPSSFTSNNPAEFTNHSGGAKGYDAEWDLIGAEFGMINNKHYLLPSDGAVSDSRLQAKGVKPIDATNDVGPVVLQGPAIGEAQIAVTNAERTMGRIEPNHTTRNTKKIRNYAQVKNADAVFAIGSLIPKGVDITIARGQATKKALVPQVNGGTSVAVQLGITMGKPTYVFNQVANSTYSQGWYKWGNIKQDFIPINTPILTKNFAGIGTSSNTTEAGKQAIRDVYEKTFNNKEASQKIQGQSVQQNSGTITSKENPMQIYVDGSDIKGTGAIGYGAYAEYNNKTYELSGTNESDSVKELQKKFPQATFSNPTMEMLGLLETLKKFATTSEHIVINQDYKGAISYGELWNYSEGSEQRPDKPWNAKEAYIKDIVDQSVDIIKQIESNGGSVKINWVKGHQTGTSIHKKGNDNADRVAKDRNIKDTFDEFNNTDFESRNNENIQERQYQKGYINENLKETEFSIRDLAARLAHRIGGTVSFESDLTKDYAGYNEGNHSVINLAKATLDTPIHEILGHPIIRAIKDKKGEHFNTWLQKTKPELFKRFSDKEFDFYSDVNKEFEDFILEITPDYIGEYKQYLDNKQQLYQNLLKELEYGKGKEVLDRVKKGYGKFDNKLTDSKFENNNIIVDNEIVARNVTKNNKTFSYIDKNGKLINTQFTQVTSLINSFRKPKNELLNLEEVQEEALVQLLGELTAGKIKETKENKNLISLLKQLLREMTTYMRSLFNSKEIEINKLSADMTLNDLAKLLAYTNSKIILPGNRVEYTTPDNKKFATYQEASNHISELTRSVEDLKDSDLDLDFNLDPLKKFIEKNKEFEQSKEIIEEWKKENNIVYNPEEVYSRGQGFYSAIGAYSTLELDLLLQNLLQHIEDNKKAGGEFNISAFTAPIGKTLKHLGGSSQVRFVIYPKSEDIKWAAPTDVYSGSVWDAAEKVSKDKKSELLGVSYSKYPSLSNVNEISPNLASIIEKRSHHHNELGIELTPTNFRLEYDESVPYEIKKLVNSVNSILDSRYGKIVKPEIKTEGIKNYIVQNIDQDTNSLIKTNNFNTKEEALNFIKENDDDAMKHGVSLVFGEGVLKGIQPTQTNETLKESLTSVAIKIREFQRLEHKEYKELTGRDYKLDYDSQAIINTKIARLKEVAKKYPRSLITSKVVNNSRSERQYQKPGSNQDFETKNNKNIDESRIVYAEDPYQSEQLEKQGYAYIGNRDTEQGNLPAYYKFKSNNLSTFAEEAFECK